MFLATGMLRPSFLRQIAAGIFFCAIQFLSGEGGVWSDAELNPVENLPQFKPVFEKCPRKNFTKEPDSPHFPNQTWYKAIISEDPENWVIMAPKIPTTAQIIIIVTSKNSHDKERIEARRSWANKYNDQILAGIVRVIFLQGDNPEDQECLKFENEKFEDLMIVKSSDYYRNLVYRTLMGMRYLAAKNPNIHLVKVFRVVVDINELVSYINSLPHDPLIQGYVSWGSAPIRNETSQWFVPESAFNGTAFPAYTQSRFYLITKSGFSEMMKRENLEKQQVFELEDAFITGVLRKSSNVNITWLDQFSLGTLNMRKCPTEKERKLVAMGSDRNIEKVYNQFMSYKERNCTRISE